MMRLSMLYKSLEKRANNMPLTNKDKSQIVETIKVCLRSKFADYKPETDNMPFHYRLLGRDRMALFSFLQSLNTTFGTSIYEPVARDLSKPRFKEVQTQYKLGNIISEGAQNEIQKIMNHLSMGGEVDKTEEIRRIKEVAQSGKENKLKSVKADLFLISKTDEVFCLYKLYETIDGLVVCSHTRRFLPVALSTVTMHS